jgi:hypothetical protein
MRLFRTSSLESESVPIVPVGEGFSFAHRFSLTGFHSIFSIFSTSRHLAVLHYHFLLIYFCRNI